MTTETSTGADAPDEVTKPVVGETQEERIVRLEQALEKSQEKIENFRKYEKRYKEQLSAEGLQTAHKLQEQLAAETEKRATLEAKVRDKAVASALEKALADAKVKAVSTTMKLIDKSKIVVADDEVDMKSVEAIIKELQTSDPVLFATEEETKPAPTPAHPPVKKATEGDVVAGYEVDMRKARNAKEIEAVMRKYGKMQ